MFGEFFSRPYLLLVKTETFFKNNRKLKRVQFVDCQADRITYEFLKQGQADLNGITLLANE